MLLSLDRVRILAVCAGSERSRNASKISWFVFWRWTKVLRVWTDMRVSNSWQNFNFWVNYQHWVKATRSLRRDGDNEVRDASFQILIHVLVQCDEIVVRQQLEQRASDAHDRHLRPGGTESMRYMRVHFIFKGKFCHHLLNLVLFQTRKNFFFCWTQKIFWRKRVAKQLMVHTDVHSIDQKIQWTYMGTICFVINRRNKHIQGWNNLRLSKGWEDFHFWANYYFKPLK